MYITLGTYENIDFYGSPNSNYCYIPILKNAHTWGVRLFENQFGFEKTENFRNKNYIVFLRDPINRWFSAVATWFKTHSNDPNIKLDLLMIDLIFSAVRLDGHSDLQIKSLNGLSLSQCVFFNTEDTKFEENFMHFLKRMSTSNVTLPPKANESKTDPVKVAIIDQLKYYYNNNYKLRQQVNFFYKSDIKLFETVQFYTPTKNNLRSNKSYDSI